ncbi:rab-GTPase-TBC domain-containing protein [Lipomyces arxii]|uniref:rab-GTPase-TBC domain-containing protein n=1 Tax=Lipomyces arxii TaxID=56418 RepID=UPI0034CDD95E
MTRSTSISTSTTELPQWPLKPTKVSSSTIYTVHSAHKSAPSLTSSTSSLSSSTKRIDIKRAPLFIPHSVSSWSLGRHFPITNPTEARDRYGFRTQTQYISSAEYDEWATDYDHYCRHRRRKWDSLIRHARIPLDHDRVPTRFPAKSRTLKRYVRKGIPPDWRGAAWFWFANGPQYLDSNPGLYDRLAHDGVTNPPPDSDSIERDLHRTFPDNIHFRASDAFNSVPSTPGSGSGSGSGSRRNSIAPETPVVQALRRVLYAFSLYVPKTGYCQSLNFIAGLLLLFMPEEHAFWTLVVITQKYLPHMHEFNLEGANVDQAVLMLSLKDAIPAVYAKIAPDVKSDQELVTKLPPITLCTASWFMSAFIGILPIESVLRIWDCFFYDDSKVFFRIALTILKLCEPQIIASTESSEIFQIVQTWPKHLLDPNALMHACFKRDNGFGHLSQLQIIERRKYVTEKRKAVVTTPTTTNIDVQLTTKAGKQMQALRIGTTNMLSLNASDDYFTKSHDMP